MQVKVKKPVNLRHASQGKRASHAKKCKSSWKKASQGKKGFRAIKKQSRQDMLVKVRNVK